MSEPEPQEPLEAVEYTGNMVLLTDEMLECFPMGCGAGWQKCKRGGNINATEAKVDGTRCNECKLVFHLDCTGREGVTGVTFTCLGCDPPPPNYDEEEEDDEPAPAAVPSVPALPKYMGNMVLLHPDDMKCFPIRCGAGADCKAGGSVTATSPRVDGHRCTECHTVWHTACVGMEVEGVSFHCLKCKAKAEAEAEAARMANEPKKAELVEVEFDTPPPPIREPLPLPAGAAAASPTLGGAANGNGKRHPESAPISAAAASKQGAPGALADAFGRCIKCITLGRNSRAPREKLTPYDSNPFRSSPFRAVPSPSRSKGPAVFHFPGQDLGARTWQESGAAGRR